MEECHLSSGSSSTRYEGSFTTICSAIPLVDSTTSTYSWLTLSTVWVDASIAASLYLTSVVDLFASHTLSIHVRMLILSVGAQMSDSWSISTCLPQYLKWASGRDNIQAKAVHWYLLIDRFPSHIMSTYSSTLAHESSVHRSLDIFCHTDVASFQTGLARPFAFEKNA